MMSGQAEVSNHHRAHPTEGPQGSERWLGPGRFAALLALLVFVTFPSVLLGLDTFVFRDFGMFGYPLAFFHRESFWRGELPLWNPLNQCGLPFLAQWNTLTLYPGSLLYLLFPLTWSLPFFCLAHLFWGGLGMYFLARRWTGDQLAAGLAGVIFSFNGLTQSFLMWPNDVASFAWLPWMFYLGPEGWRNGRRPLAFAVLAGAMQMLSGGPEVILVTWGVLLALWIRDLGRGAQAPFGEESEVELAAAPRLSMPRTYGPRLKIAWRLVLLVLLISLISAAQLLPFLELLGRSQRDPGYAAASHNWSMPFWGYANFLVPLFRTSPTAQGVFLQNGQYWTSSYYAGVGTLLLGLSAVWRTRDWRVGLAGIAMILGAAFALGDNGFLFPAIRAGLPVLGFARYPVKFVILTLAFAPLLAALGLKALSNQARPSRKFELGCALAMLFLIGLTVTVDWNAGVPNDVRDATLRNALGRAFFLLLTAAIIWRFPVTAQEQGKLAGWPNRKGIIFGCLLLVVFWLDLGSHMPNQNPVVRPGVYAPGLARQHLNWNPAPELGHSRALVSLEVKDGLSVNWLPDLEKNYLRNRLAARADCNLLDGVPQIDGFYSLVPREINSVLSLPYKKDSGDLTALLDFAGVSQITKPASVIEWAARSTAMPLVTCGQRPVFATDQTALEAFSKTNTDFRDTVFLPLEARGSVLATQRGEGRVLRTTFDRQKITFDTESPGETWAVISQTFYPSWQAYLDGVKTRLWRANYGFQAVQVPAGHHHVELRFEDKSFRLGLILSASGLVAWLALWLFAGQRTGAKRRAS